MERKYIKLNDNYSHLSLGNVINVIKEESKNKTSAIQSEVFCALFNLDYINESTVNNYCVGSRSIGNDYKQIYINLQKKYQQDEKIFIPIISNILTIISGTIYDINNIKLINENTSLKNIDYKLYNISKNDFYVSKELITKYRELLNNHDYYNLFIQMLFFAILDKKQPLYEDEKLKNVVETILANTDISVVDLQNFLLLELNEGINFSHSLINLRNNHNPYASYHLGILEYRGEFSGKPRYDQAYLYFKEAAQDNHPAACWMIGNMLIKGIIGKKSPDDLNEAIKYFTKAQSLGNVAAINSLGLCYQNGWGVTKNTNKALALFKEAAHKNYAYALNNLGLYFEKQGQNAKAYEYYQKSAMLNESYACNKIGEMFRLAGQTAEAFTYYEKAIQSKLNETCLWAYYNLAKYYYLTGDYQTNILKDLNKAIQYLEIAQDLIESLEELLWIYYDQYLNNNDDSTLAKVYYYKDLIEKHPQYNNDIANLINNKLNQIKKKKKIILP